MARYYITRRDSSVLALDATVTLSERFSARPTAHPVVSGETISDSIVQDLAKFELEGIISGVAQPHRQEIISISDVTQEIVDTIKKGEIVRFQSADREYPICVLTDVSFNKTSKEGVEGWQVRISLSQILLNGRLESFIRLSEGLSDEDQAILDSIEDYNRKREATTQRMSESEARSIRSNMYWTPAGWQYRGRTLTDEELQEIDEAAKGGG